jgi:hypothetical protein
MSNPKTKLISDLARKTGRDRDDALHFKSPLHRDAFDFHVAILSGLFWLKANPKTWPQKYKRWIKYQHEAVENFRKRYLNACLRKDGKFFRALADVLDHGASNDDWSPLERYIDAQCRVAIHFKEKLPSPGQLKRGWMLHCGQVPTRADDLALVWRLRFKNIDMPTSRAEIEKALRPFFGEENHSLANIQHKQIKAAAKQLGYDLPRQRSHKCLPAGFALVH